MGVAIKLLNRQHVIICSMPKMSTNNSLPGYTPIAFKEYINSMIGEYKSELEKLTFTDKKQTTYFMAIKFNATLVWESYNQNQNMFYKEQNLAMVNTDVLNTALLSLHPINLVEEKDISEDSKKALVDLTKFRDLILLKNNEESDVKTWLQVAPNMNYSGQLCLMGWFLTLASKMTGILMPGIERMVVVGQILKDKNNWNFFAQYSTLKKMYEDLNFIVEKF